MNNGRRRQIIRYKFDNFISKGSGSIFLSLVVIFISILLLIGGIRGGIYLLYPEGAEQFEDVFKHVYITFLQLTDPGNMSQDIPSAPHYKIPAVLAGLAGVILLSMLIAVITTALDQKLNELKKGRSKVLENGHALILGWNERVIEILRELIMANESEDNPSVVILSGRDKEYMDDILRTHLPDTANTRIITRSGNTSSLIDLDRVTVEDCKSVIVLANCVDTATPEEKSVSDAKVIKTVLAIIATKSHENEHNIVVEIFDQKNREIVEQISPNEITTVDTVDILAKILVQTSRTSGLAVVYGEILSFDGCELYFYNTDWRGAKFGQLQYNFSDGVPVGIKNKDGNITVNPSPDTSMQADDDILILAEDDSTIKFNREPVTRPTIHPLKEGKLEARKERNLILGWNPKAIIFINELADYVRDDSEVDIVMNHPPDSIKKEVEKIQSELGQLRISLIDNNPLLNETLIGLKPFTYDNIIILSQGRVTSDPEKIDSETIIILLLLRSIFRDYPAESKNTKLITEVMDSENQELISRAGVNDFIISNRFISNILAQISEEADIKGVYDDLFQEGGSEIYLKPASLYFNTLPLDVSFADMMAIANKRQEICIGVRLYEYAEDIRKNFGVKLIPEKNTRYTLIENDTLVVVAEDEK